MQIFGEDVTIRKVVLSSAIVLATDSTGRKYDIEVQRADKGAGRKRARYNSSMLDVNTLHKNTDFDELPETYVIFITENDVLGRGLPVYCVERSKG